MLKTPPQGRAKMGIQLFAQIDNNLAALAGKQAPFIASVALNKTAIGARDRVRANLPKRFTLRNNWTVGGVQARMSTKHDLLARVVAPDYMAIQETGGTRKPTGSRLLAAPGEALPTQGVIPKNARPRALLRSGAFIIGDGANAGVFERYGKGRRDIRLLWWLTPTQQYDERFEFEKDVNDYVSGNFASHFMREWAKAQGSART